MTIIIHTYCGDVIQYTQKVRDQPWLILMIMQVAFRKNIMLLGMAEQNRLKRCYVFVFASHGSRMEYFKLVTIPTACDEWASYFSQLQCVATINTPSQWSGVYICIVIIRYYVRILRLLKLCYAEVLDRIREQGREGRGTLFKETLK